MAVRKFKTEDLEAVIDVASALHPQWFTEAALQEIASDVQRQNAYVATLNEKIVGFASYQTSDVDKNAELTWIGVLSEMHRHGIGRMMMDTIEHAAAREGVKMFEVCTVAETVEYEPYALTRRFYHALGFRDLKIELKGFPSGDDKLILRKQLQT